MTIAREIAWDLPIVVLTADVDSAVSDRAIRSGANGCLVKGAFRPETLVEAIIDAVDGRRADSISPGVGVVVIPVDGAMDCLRGDLQGETLSLRIAQGAETRVGSGGDWFDRSRRSSNWTF